MTTRRTEIWADGADRQGMLAMSRRPEIKGFTTNPTLMRKAGIEDYESFAKDILSAISDRPVSFEVFADEFAEMERQAHRIAGWGRNVLVKIPITNTRGEPSYPLIRRLARMGVPLNVTAVLTLEQVRQAHEALADGPASVISVFAGRIADTGINPVPLMQMALHILQPCRNQRLLWASPRELLNLVQAEQIGCPLITMTQELLEKLPLLGRDLRALSLETVRMFHRDARAAGYRLAPVSRPLAALR